MNVHNIVTEHANSKNSLLAVQVAWEKADTEAKE